MYYSPRSSPASVPALNRRLRKRNNPPTIGPQITPEPPKTINHSNIQPSFGPTIMAAMERHSQPIPSPIKAGTLWTAPTTKPVQVRVVVYTTNESPIDGGPSVKGPMSAVQTEPTIIPAAPPRRTDVKREFHGRPGVLMACF